MDHAAAIDAVLARHQEVGDAQERARQAVEDRSTALRAAHAAGVTWTELGKLLGVSGARIIAMAKPAQERAASRSQAKG